MPKQADRRAGTVLTARLAEQTRVLGELADAVRTNQPDAVHQMRIACRRLRGALKAYGSLLESDAGTAAELRWLGGELGRARDAEVLGERLLAAAGELPPECEPEPVVARLNTWWRERYAAAWPGVLAALDNARYRALLATLELLVARPPFTARAGRPAGREIKRTLRREQRRTLRRIDAAMAAEPGPEQERALHEARKAAKRARYAGETAGPSARRYTARMKALQDLLGVHQDTVIACQALRELAAEPDAPAFGYGILYARQITAAANARQQLPRAALRARKRPH